MTNFLNGLLKTALAVACVVAVCAGAAAQGIETRAGQAFLVDAETGTVLFAKDADRQVPPAALAKLMTMEVVFHAIKEGRLKLDDAYTVSEHAWRKGGAPSGGATMFAALKSSIPVRDLIQGVIVQGANDACIILAEGMTGSEDNFTKLMNERAAALALAHSTFKNPHGLEAAGQHVSMRDMTTLAIHMRRNYPDLYAYYAQSEFTWNKILQRNRNPLLAMNIGVDGLATGASKEGGMAIVASAQQDGRRLFAALSGLANESDRADEAKRLLEWGFRAFQKKDLYALGEVVGEAKVFGGARSTVPLIAKGPLQILLPTENRDRLIARVVYRGPVVAPVQRGQQIGALKVWIGDQLTQETALYAAEAVDEGTLTSRAMDAVEELLVGWLR